MKDQCAELRRQILEDVLGDNVEEYENFSKETVTENKRQHRQRIPLWQFLLHLLNRDTIARYIEWSHDRVLEFRIKDTMAVADLWGSVKNKTDMTYEKLGRAMRYYYGKSIIEKVSGRRYTYRFIMSRRTKKYLSQFINTSGMTMERVEADASEGFTGDLTVLDSSPDSPDGGECDTPPTPPPVKVKRRNTSEPIKIKPFKPTPQQTFTKTKIFKPEELLNKRIHFQSSLSYAPMLLGKSCDSFMNRDADRRSAFKAIKTNEEACKTKIYRSMPLLDRMQPTELKKESLVSSARKRKYPGDTCQCSACTPHGGSTSDDASECESYGSMSPRELIVHHADMKNYSSFKKSQNEEFIIRKETRKDLRDKQERNILELQQKLQLNRRVDPFMGYDYLRHDTDTIRYDSLYDSLDDYMYDASHRRHAWAA